MDKNEAKENTGGIEFANADKNTDGFLSKEGRLIRNLHFLSKNSTLISRKYCRFFWVKNS